MRFLIAAVATTCLAASATHAADLDLGPLRGTGYNSYGSDLSTVADWSGVYVGGFGGYGQSNFENKGGGRDLLAREYRNTTIENEFNISNLLQLKSKDARDTAFGGFIGYNFQLDEAVLGIEADYTQTELRGTSTDEIGRSMTTADGRYNIVRLAGTATTELKGYGTVRVRAGYTIGSLMPFVTAGVALGQLETSTTVSAQVASFNPTGPFYNPIGFVRFDAAAPTYFDCSNPLASCLRSPNALSRSKSTVAVGITAGAGLEYMLTSNIFVRGEYQYAFFNDFDGHKFNVNLVRGGAGVKF
jgi:outer membrane immunogenic protein